jgi:hypothetical protein
MTSQKRLLSKTEKTIKVHLTLDESNIIEQERLYPLLAPREFSFNDNWLAFHPIKFELAGKIEKLQFMKFKFMGNFRLSG